MPLTLSTIGTVMETIQYICLYAMIIATMYHS